MEPFVNFVNEKDQNGKLQSMLEEVREEVER